MSGKRLSRADRETIAQLVQKSSVDAVVKVAKAARDVPARGRGRPPHHEGNLSAVYGYLHHHRNQKMAGGRRLGLAGACDRLMDVLDKFTVGNQVTAGRLRTMYYQALKLARSNPGFDRLMRASPAKYKGYDPLANMPLLMIAGRDGLLRSPTIDRFGRGGRPVIRQ